MAKISIFLDATLMAAALRKPALATRVCGVLTHMDVAFSKR